ncbi:MAG: ATP-binding cassette domain-containing protein [Actinomycetota bacterium]|nr:ATP-binding cassette domain-containing protein [Actinomycetota bacterium]
MTVVLRAEALVVRYGGVVALDGVDLSVSSGEVVGLVGANGAGKTTLLDCLSGHLRPVGGRVWLGTSEISRLGPGRRARRGVVRSFQDARLFPTMPVGDALLLAQERVSGSGAVTSLLGWPPSPTRARRRRAAAEDLAAGLMLEPFLGRLVGALSTGDRKRLDLACAIGLEPRVLLLDEPSAGLAAADLQGLAARLRGAAERSRAGVVMVEHDLPLVWSVADRVVVLDSGQVAAAGPPAELRGHPSLAFGRLG